MTVSRKQLKAVVAPLVVATLLVGCAQAPLERGALQLPMPMPRTKPAAHAPIDPDLPALPAAGSGRGGYYKDDGPGDNPPPNLRDTADAVVRAEPLSRWANRPYVVFGKSYTPMAPELPFSQRGIGSWYGKKFHGQKTSSGEIYDMYKMTAAHPTLPIPSYARITHVGSGKQITVRVNDRGPFHAGRIVDLSYTAALKLGLLGKGSQEVHLERLLPDAPGRVANAIRMAPDAPDAADDIDDLLLTSKAEARALKAHAGEPYSIAAAPAPADGFYVQLGAFSQAAKAADIRSRVAASRWSATVEVVAAGALHKVMGGPFESREQAMEALRAVPSALGLKPIVVRR